LGPLDYILKSTPRSSIWRVLAIYLAGSWVALEVVQGIVDAGNLPDWLPGMALVLLIIGFPIVVTTAVIQAGGATGGATGGEAVDEGADDGAARGRMAAGAAGSDAEGGIAAPGPRPAARPASHSLFTWKNAMLGGLGAFALWGVVAAVLLGTGRAGATGSPSGVARASIAVLPFLSTLDDESSRSFTLGIHDDLLTQLSKVGSLRVISRTSVMEYKETTKNIREIGDELGVSTLLEGSIQRAGNRIHLNAQLIDAATDEHLWAETYDRTLTVENVFHIQRELAEAIAAELHATLTPDEVASIAAPPTKNLEAYDYYLQGNVYFSRGPRSEEFEIALDMYGKAVELDPGFALAYARLALTHGFIFQLRGRDPEDLAASREAVDRALALDPDLPEGHLALGEYHYWGPRDFGSAIDEYDKARAAGLNTYDLHHALGAVRRRLSDFDGSIDSFREAIRLEPRSAHIWEDLGSTYQAMGRFAEAEEALTHATDMAPDVGGTYWWLLNTIAARDGNTARAREVVERGRETVDGNLNGQLNFLDAMDGEWQAILDRIETPRPWNRGDRARALAALGRADEARILYDSIRIGGEEVVSRNPRAADTDLTLAYAYAALGQAQAAHDEIARVRAVVEGDAMDGPTATFSEVFVYTRLGEHDRAFESLERLFEGLPHDVPPRYMALFSSLQPLHADQRWEEMMGRYRQPVE